MRPAAAALNFALHPATLVTVAVLGALATWGGNPTGLAFSIFALLILAYDA